VVVASELWECLYKYLCLIEQLEMKDKYNQILIRYRPQLVDKMENTELLNLLISKNVLTPRQVKSINVCMSLLCTFQNLSFYSASA